MIHVQLNEILAFGRFLEERVAAGEPEESVLSRYPILARLWREQRSQAAAAAPVDLRRQKLRVACQAD